MIGERLSAPISDEEMKMIYTLVENDEGIGKYIDRLVDLAGNYKGHIAIDDFFHISNWGIYKGHPVIIDLGLTMDVFNDHYKF